MRSATTYAINGENLFVQEGGKATLPCVLLLHSLGTSSELWLPQFEALTETYRLIAIDLRGHGLSTNQGGFSIANCADDALAVLKRLGCTKVHLVGISMGGLVAAQLALHMKSDADLVCQSLTLACSYRSLAGPLSLARIETARQAIARDGMQRFARKYVADTLCEETSAGTLARLETMVASVEPAHYVQTLECILSFDSGPVLELLQTLPTLILKGSLDRRVSAEAHADLCARLPGAKRVELESAGHLANVENPPAFNAALREFWENGCHSEKSSVCSGALRD